MTILKQLAELIVIMESMHQHALQGDWQEVTNLDNQRQKFLQAFNPDKSTDSASQLTEQVQCIRELDNKIVELAVAARQSSAREHSSLKTKRSQCKEYQQLET